MIETAREGHPLAPKLYRTKTFLVEREKDEGLTSIQTCREKRYSLAVDKENRGHVVLLRPQKEVMGYSNRRKKRIEEKTLVGISRL